MTDIDLTAFRKRIKNHSKKILKIKDKIASNEATTKDLVHAILWNLFGFPEAQIDYNKEEKLITVYKNDTEQYGIFIVDYEKNPNIQADEYRLVCKKHLLKKAVLTDGARWTLCEFDDCPPLKARTVEEILIDENSLKATSFPEEAVPLLSDSQELESTTNYYNKKRWYGFKSETDSNLARFKVLVDFEIYSNDSERVYVPLLDKIYWSDMPFGARNLALADIREHLNKSLKGKESLGSPFETIAYRNANQTLLENTSISPVV